MDSKNVPALMTKGEAAAYCRFSERTINRWVERQWLVARRLPNGQLRFRKEDLDQALDKQWSEEAGNSQEPQSELG